MSGLTKDDIRSDLWLYTQFVFLATRGVPIKENWHQRLICEKLEQVVTGDITRLIINIPPRSGKTMLAVHMFMSWYMGNFPWSEFIHASYSKRLATVNTYAVRSIMQEQSYIDLFPSVKLKQDSQAKDEFRTEQGGIVYAAGTGGTITGYGAGGMSSMPGGCILLDDCHKPDEAQSDIVRNNVLEWFSQTMENRKNSPDTPIIYISQRLHEQDLPGWLLSGGNGEDWHLLKIPAQDEEGKSFWPEQFPESMLERLARKQPYIFSGQYMQDPAPQGGGDFKPSNIEIVNALPRRLNYVRGWDLAGTTRKHSDYTATVKLAIDDHGIIWIAHADHFKGAPDEVQNAIQQHAATDRDTFTSLPDDPGQAGTWQAQFISRALQGRRFEFTPESGDKITRAMPLASQVNIGNVKMLAGDWNADLLAEMRVFPNGAHDDLIDAISRAYNVAANASNYRLDFL